MFDVRLPKEKDVVPFLEWCLEYVGPPIYSRNCVAGKGWCFLDIIKIYKHTYLRFNNVVDAMAFVLRFEL